MDPQVLEYLKYTGLFALSVWVFWALYVFAMGVYRAYLDDRLRGLNYVFAAPIFLVAALVDVFFNLVVAPIVFLDLPREWLVTQRLQRYIAKGPKAGFRYRWAKIICDGVLDPFDPRGDHC